MTLTVLQERRAELLDRLGETDAQARDDLPVNDRLVSVECEEVASRRGEDQGTEIYINVSRARRASK